jgi:hypothetical protein
MSRRCADLDQNGPSLIASFHLCLLSENTFGSAVTGPAVAGPREADPGAAESFVPRRRSIVARADKQPPRSSTSRLKPRYRRDLAAMAKIPVRRRRWAANSVPANRQNRDRLDSDGSPGSRGTRPGSFCRRDAARSLPWYSVRYPLNARRRVLSVAVQPRVDFCSYPGGGRFAPRSLIVLFAAMLEGFASPGPGSIRLASRDGHDYGRRVSNR